MKAFSTQNKKLWFLLPAIVIALAASWYYFAGRSKSGPGLTTKVEYGDFNINVTTTGELEALSSENILGPTGLREVRIWQVQISDIIAEGTLVDSGQYVATLDRTEITNRMKDLESEVEKLESQFIKTKLDTSMDLRAAREELVNMNYALEEKQITVEQSIYEPPATQRQAKLDLEKAQRAFQQAQKNYKLKLEKARANMQEVSASFSQEQRRLEQIREVLKGFTITAPKAGMLIYKRNWDGTKMGIGATMSSWDNIVATLPNLKEMISKTYVNEIDISKLKTGQKAEISVDAFPERKYTGIVTEVANIGEQMRNSNAKVFEVKIRVHEFDSILRPAMTTKNIISTSIIPRSLYLPIECIHTTDSITFVYLPGSTRQQIKTGLTNENQIIVTEGLKQGDEVYLSPPENSSEWRLKKL
ncbi:MAG: efflux RND transporter periplasmic adaptor subunit [Lentimicrobiaceae bacterium]|nr:efflux RND transporter periplasmic adaptor subunit [Lentimicrobiaceae bacterium]MCB9024384.1 efflux RND transporter periplasmic adaptor subunit [Lentimicrobiaceae bacterium]MCO5266081.1 efflux RND transporter periplasmic adaptor subunit [Lentimicrobium sp.]